ncbi:hypothetical protein P700755_003967 [Psychroflexus torquis ATCC 700755]|uniref:Uncharacterized protein n=2 Tax=Psychroflexus TaxID=83612 RepID=K4INE2_PSYTT|nr:hypothetical protein P700755_003967 [Psychroflexus torquis ATCC 700755]
MRVIFTIAALLINLIGFSQSIQSITNKVSTKICDCMDNDMQSYSEIKPEFNKCYDKEFNQIFSIVDKDEQKILIGEGVIDKIKNRIIPSLNKNCEKVRRLIDAELKKSIEPANSNKSKTYPINFEEKDFEEIGNWKNKIIALEGQVVQVERSSKNTPYSKLKIGNKEIWVISMIDSGFEKVDNTIKIVGYFIPLKKDDYESKFNQDKYQILAFGILDLKTKDLRYFPGSEIQMKEWKSGKIPSSGK